MPAVDYLRLERDAGGQTAPKRQSSVRAGPDSVSSDACAEDITWAIEGMLQPGADAYPLGRLGAIWAYVKRIRFWGVMDAASIDDAHPVDFDRLYHYFRSVCRRKLRQIGVDQ